jgi:hypothetical protein
MPKELEPLYRHLLSLIEPVYLSWASKAFQIVRAHRDNYLRVAWLEYPEITGIKLSISTLRLAITETINVAIKPKHARIVEQVSPIISH